MAESTLDSRQRDGGDHSPTIPGGKTWLMKYGKILSESVTA
jgi:hypothetical protein